MSLQVPRRSIFDIWFQNSRDTRFNAIMKHILQQVYGPPLSDTVLESMKTILRRFCQKLKEKWNKSERDRRQFLRDNSLWLQGQVIFNIGSSEAQPSTSGTASSGSSRKAPEDRNPKVKRRKFKHIVESTSHKESAIITEITHLKSEKWDSAFSIKDLPAASSQRSTKIKKVRKTSLERPPELSWDQALALIIDANLSTNQYNMLRNQATILRSNLYPPYYKVREAKKRCYPSASTITEISAEIPLQSIVNHTVTRLCEVQEEVFETLNLSENTDINIIIKWGCDVGEKNKYRQKYSEEDHNDENMFSISMVPIQLYVGSGEQKYVIWQNPLPSSIRYCRPIKFIFAKDESGQLITTEVKKIETQVAALSPSRVIMNGTEVLVKTTLIFCMIDGEVCNAVSSYISTQTCYLCGAKPDEMNNLNITTKKKVDANLLGFGLSPLYCWIRLFECLLHISYRLEIKSWEVHGEENKKKVLEKKIEVQDKFEEEFGLLIDTPKPETGNTNDGITARQFFRNAEKSAEITGINVNLIKRFRVILECINSEYLIKLEKFEEYLQETRELYLQEYSWYLMPVSVHKILYHGKDIVVSCILPIGQFSEETQEFRNKHNRQYRELFSRKTSRVDINTDLLNRLLITSDPVLTSLRASPKVKRREITTEALSLLQEPPYDLDSRDYHSDSGKDTDSE